MLKIYDYMNILKKEKACLHADKTLVEWICIWVIQQSHNWIQSSVKLKTKLLQLLN